MRSFKMAHEISSNPMTLPSSKKGAILYRDILCRIQTLKSNITYIHAFSQVRGTKMEYLCDFYEICAHVMIKPWILCCRDPFLSWCFLPQFKIFIPLPNEVGGGGGGGGGGGILDSPCFYLQYSVKVGGGGAFQKHLWALKSMSS